MLFFVFLFLVAGIAMYLAGRKLERDATASQRWPTVEGTLKRAEIVERPGIRPEDVSSWQLQVEYSYVVRGVNYHGTRYAFGFDGGLDDGPYRAVAEKLSHLEHVRVHYDPAHPTQAVLDTTVPTGLTSLGRFGLVMAVVSALLGTIRICF